jgi:hypothetical protein
VLSPIWGPRPHLCYCQTVACSFLWGAFSDEMTGLSFTIATGPRQCSHYHITTFYCLRFENPQPRGSGSRIYIPQDQGDSVIPPGTGFPFRRFLRLTGPRWRYLNSLPHGLLFWFESESYVTTDGQSVSLSWNKATSEAYGHIVITVTQLRVCCGALSLTRGRVCLLYMLLALSGPSPVGLAIIFYSLRFETSLFVASYDWQGYDGGIRSRLHMGFFWFVQLASLCNLSTESRENTVSMISLLCVYSPKVPPFLCAY